MTREVFILLSIMTVAHVAVAIAYIVDLYRFSRRPHKYLWVILLLSIPFLSTLIYRR